MTTDAELDELYEGGVEWVATAADLDPMPDYGRVSTPDKRGCDLCGVGPEDDCTDDCPSRRQ